MDNKINYDAIVFDNDGVIVEPTDPTVHRDAVREAFRSFGIDDVTPEIIDRLIEISGDDRDELSAQNVRRACERNQVDPSEFWQHREQIAAEAQLVEMREGRKELYPDFDAVCSLGCPLGIVSNNQVETVQNVLDEFGCRDIFDVVYGREATLTGIERRKPDPYYVQTVIEELGADAPLLVGDSDVDIRTADQLDIDSVFVRRPHREGYSLSVEPTYEIDSLRELPSIVER